MAIDKHYVLLLSDSILGQDIGDVQVKECVFDVGQENKMLTEHQIAAKNAPKTKESAINSIIALTKALRKSSNERS